MMEIENRYLFRGVSVETGQWEFGDLRNLPDGTRYIGKFRLGVIPETVGQWTGLCDANGVKIFEGDIIKTTTNAELEVRYGNSTENTYGWALRSKEFNCIYPLDPSLTKMEITGSIHDHHLKTRGNGNNDEN